MITMRILMSTAGESAEVPDVVQAGIFSISTDVLMMLAAAINIFVINAVKFFFEVLIWLTPVPFLDAVFEVLNKTLCAVLMAVYAWSPGVATILNLAMFAASAIAFGWIHRRQVFFRTMFLDLLLGMISTPRPRTTITVFPTFAVGGIRARALCTLERTETGWLLQHRRFLRSTISVLVSGEQRAAILRGILSNSIIFTKPAMQLTFSRLYNASLPELATELNATLPDCVDASRQRQTELA